MLIAFSGKRGVGKTSAAKYLNKFYGFDLVSFADSLKESCMKLFPFTKEQIYGAEKEIPCDFLGEHTPREFMIKFGQFMRYWDKDYWIKQLSLKIPYYDTMDYVIDDLRYNNEAVFLKSLGATLVRIERYESQNPYKGIIEDTSETDLDTYSGFDFKIHEVDNVDLSTLYGTVTNHMTTLDKQPIRRIPR